MYRQYLEDNMFNTKTKERKFKAFLLIFTISSALTATAVIDQEIYYKLAIFCGSFYAGSNVLSKVVDVVKK